MRFSRTVSLIGPLTCQGCQNVPEAMGEMGQSRGLWRACGTKVNGKIECAAASTGKDTVGD